MSMCRAPLARYAAGAAGAVIAVLVVGALPAADDGGVQITRWGTTGLIVSAPAVDGDARIASRLGGRMNATLTDAGIEEVAALIRESVGINVVVDPALRARDPKVTQALSQVSAQTVVQWAARLGGYRALTVDQALYLTDRTEAPSERRSVVFYDVSDLVAAPRDFPAPQAVQAYLPMSQGEAGGGAAAPSLFPSGGAAPAAAGDTPEQRIAALEESIRAMLRAQQAR